MAKVTIMIEPEEEHEGEYGHTTLVSKGNVISLDQLVDVYLGAAKGFGWKVDRIGAVLDSGPEFWGES